MLDLLYLGLGVGAVTLYVLHLWPVALVVKRLFKKLGSRPLGEIMEVVSAVEIFSAAIFLMSYFGTTIGLYLSILAPFVFWAVILLISLGYKWVKKSNIPFMAKMRKNEVFSLVAGIILFLFILAVVIAFCSVVGKGIYTLIWPPLG